MHEVIIRLIIIVVLAIIIYGIVQSSSIDKNLNDEVIRKDIHSIAFWVKFFSIATLIGWGALFIFIIYMRSKM